MKLRRGLLIGAVLSGSCSAGDPAETRLVSRTWPDELVTCDAQLVCRIVVPSMTFRSDDGRTGWAEAFESTEVLERLRRGEVECAGELTLTDMAFRLHDAGVDERPQALVFDDGSAVDLFLESWVSIIDTCFEEVGRWEGIAGTFEGRSGTYRWIDDMVQVEVVLTDG